MGGIEWIVDADGCDPAALRDRKALERLFRRIVDELRLNPVGRPVWHAFPPPGGVTGAWILAESHLTLHTFPEHATLCLNLFCCRRRPRPDWRDLLSSVAARPDVHVRRIFREYSRAGIRC